MTLSRVDRWQLVLMVALCIALLAMAYLVPAYRAKPWKDQARELPVNLSSIYGAYARIVDGRPMLVRMKVVYMDMSSEKGYAETWIEDDGRGGAGRDLGRPYRWSREKVGTMPEIPDLYLEAMARK